MVFDADNRPIDYRFLEINPAFEAQTGLRDARGKLMRSLAPDHEEHWFQIYGKVALTGEPARFVNEAKALNGYYDVSAYRVGGPDSRKVAILFNDISERMQAEEAMRQSERRERERAEELAVLFEAVPTAVFIARDPDCLHLTGNRLADEILRISHGEELSMSGPPETRPRHFRALKNGRELRLDELPAQRAARGERVKDLEFTLAFDDGVIRHVLGYGTPLLDDQGHSRGCVAVLVDITDRKRAEEALRESEGRYRLLHDTMLPGVVYQDAAGVFISANPSALRIMGITSQDFLGETSTTRQSYCVREDGTPFPGDEHPSMVALRTGREVRNVQMGVYNLGKDQLRWVSVDSVPLFRDDEDKPYQVYTIFDDITDRKQAENALQTALHRFYDVLASMYTGVLLVTDDGRVEFANQALCDRFGLTEPPADLVGLAAGEMVEKIKNGYLHPDQAVARIRQIVDRGQPVKGEEVAMRDGGTCLRDFVPLTINGKSFGRLWIHVDITERKRVEEEIRRHLEELRAANEELERFNRAAVDRELRMIELKKEINGLCAQAGQPTRYAMESQEEQS